MTALLHQPYAEEDDIVSVNLFAEDLRLLLVAADILQEDEATSSECQPD
jgi:hypothetical protein